MKEFQKIISTLLKGKTLRTPFVISDEEDSYFDSLQYKLEEYIRRLEKLKTRGPITEWIKNNIISLKNVNTLLLGALEEYLKGNSGKAYDVIEELMSCVVIRDNLVKLKAPLDHVDNNTHDSKSLYRVRYSDYPLSRRKDIFHIPFEKRYLVDTQRFSIAGLPCLYLGSSLYVCWQEMGKPDLNKLYLSYYKINSNNSYGNINVLDFAYSLETLKHVGIDDFFVMDESETEEKFISYIAMWPILLACSFNKEVNNSKFNVEYVIPNLILQWISKDKRPVSGIRYFSTKTTHLRHSDVGINYVFPPSSSTLKKHGFCEILASMFVFSKPVSWQILSTIETQVEITNSVLFARTDNFEEQLVEKYKSTQFYAMEQNLNNIMDCAEIENA